MSELVTANLPRGPMSQATLFRWFLFVGLIGLALRLVVAVTTPSEAIYTDYLTDIQIAHHNGNIYLEQAHYNYSPVQYWIRGFLGVIADWLNFSYVFTLRLFFILCDTLGCLTLIAI